MKHQEGSPEYFQAMDDILLDMNLRSLCLEITEVDVEELKPLRNAIEEVLERWRSCRIDLGAEE